MTPSRLSAPARLLVVTLAIAAWLLATNHCAFGLMQAQAPEPSGHAHCHSGTAQTGQPAPVGTAPECCKTLHGTPAPERVAAAAFCGLEMPAPAFFLSQAWSPAPLAPALTFIFDHGPPPGVSFAEAVLQRSLLSHAPPRVA